MILLASTIVVSAFLLFLVQPLIAKQLLAWFGGSAAVWTTCMVFFQTALLGGYAYAHWLATKVKPKNQFKVHAGLGAASLICMPIVLSETLKPPDGETPILRILVLLTVSIGLPYFLLSSTSPLIQAWFARQFPAQSAHRLYALSNAASMLALGAFPFVLEPLFTTTALAYTWSAVFASFVILVSICSWRSSIFEAQTPISSALNGYIAVDDSVTPADWQQQFSWLGMSAITSALLLAVTAHVTQNVASVPLMWIVPLALYLLSFILTFENKNLSSNPKKWNFAVVAFVSFVALTMMVLQTFGFNDDWKFGIFLLDWKLNVPVYCVGLFIICLFCHADLVKRKPPEKELTRFYLMIALGGAIGSFCVGVIAPLVLDRSIDLSLVLIAFLLMNTLLDPRPLLRGLGAVCTIFGILFFLLDRDLKSENLQSVQRNFYGILTVKQFGDQDSKYQGKKLLHGNINHGVQITRGAPTDLPTSYFGVNSGVGKALLLASKPNLNVGIVGLGVGTLAAYAHAGDRFRFYEIDPSVVDIAKAEFSFLKDAKTKIEIVLGDARLSMEREPLNRYDVLILDAFSGDSVPVHLLTVQAMQLYKKHIRADGMIAVHISNRYLNLKPVIAALAEQAQLRAVSIGYAPPANGLELKSEWVLLSANPDTVTGLLTTSAAYILQPEQGFRVWTDDYSNLLSALK